MLGLCKKYASKRNKCDLMELETNEKKEYEKILDVHATYSPWNIDSTFNIAYEQIKNNTLVDMYRCYELWSLVHQVSKCENGEILEVGVWRGGTGALIAAADRDAGRKDKIYLCDTFEGVVKVSEKDDFYVNGMHNDTSVETVEKLMESLKLNDYEICKGIFPDDVNVKFQAMTYRFVHIDVDVYESARCVFDFVWKNVVNGGIVVFDDYGFETTKGVKTLLNELRTSVNDGIFYHNINGHGVFIKF